MNDKKIEVYGILAEFNSFPSSPMGMYTKHQAKIRHFTKSK